MVRARPALHERPSVVQGRLQLNSWALGIYDSSNVLEKACHLNGRVETRRGYDWVSNTRDGDYGAIVLTQSRHDEPI